MWNQRHCCGRGSWKEAGRELPSRRDPSEADPRPGPWQAVAQGAVEAKGRSGCTSVLESCSQMLPSVQVSLTPGREAWDRGRSSATVSVPPQARARPPSAPGVPFALRVLDG